MFNVFLFSNFKDKYANDFALKLYNRIIEDYFKIINCDETNKRIMYNF